VGYVDAPSREAAVSILSGHELYILKVEGETEAKLLDRFAGRFSGIRRQDMVIFTRQFATLLEARLSLSKALSTLYDQTTNPSLKAAVAQISQDVDSGLALSQAMEHQPDVFSSFFVSMVRSAEVTGNLDRVVVFLADYTEREANLISKARSAMIYPAIIVILFLVVAIIMMTVVFPQIKPIFEQSGVDLPFLSKIFLNSGEFLARWWVLILAVVAVGAVMLSDYFRGKEGRAIWDDLKIKAPIVRKVYLPITISRFANASGMLLKGGVPVAQAMEIVGETIDNALYREVLHEVSNDVRQGITLSEAVAKKPGYFPSLVAQMIAVGETTGQLSQMFDRVANFYSREADERVSNVVDLIQPILLVVVAVFVGLLFGSILLPLYRLTSAFQ